MVMVMVLLLLLVLVLLHVVHDGKHVTQYHILACPQGFLDTNLYLFLFCFLTSISKHFYVSSSHQISYQFPFISIRTLQFPSNADQLVHTLLMELLALEEDLV